ncbi:DNA translocase [Entomoplasma ellychniae]|uniref:DNA translocase n=1 Tax=Entomoplasma ellychniae TaxID=2114 RepID=A0A8E2UAU5_9MOLU|nr:DNA translocase FtsK [Entomoplasma ellychniae]PPE04876.1 DNA translocase [Entomoplasma ellychniae]
MPKTLKEEEILANHNWNEDRTSAFITTKTKRRNDSISWVVTGFTVLFFSVISFTRLTVIGQFFDDIIFNFLFGWFKYFVYLLLFFVDICIFTGIRFKFKKRFIFMLFLSFVILCWLITLILYSFQLSQKQDFSGLWQKDIFSLMFINYSEKWFINSIFYPGNFHNALHLLFKPEIRGYFNFESGGGIIGAFLTGVTAYTSIVGAFSLWFFVTYIHACWVLTGDPFYLFKAKNKRKGKSLRILSLNAKRNPNLKQRLKEAKKLEASKVQNELTKEAGVEPLKPISRWESINVFGQNIDLEEDIKTSDLTIQMPSYFKNEDKKLDDLEEINEIEHSSVNLETEEISQLIQPQYKFISRRQRTEQELARKTVSQKPSDFSINEPTANLTTSNVDEFKTITIESALEEKESLQKIKEDVKEQNSIKENLVNNDEGDETFLNSIYEEKSLVAQDITIDFFKDDMQEINNEIIFNEVEPQIITQEENVSNPTIEENLVILETQTAKETTLLPPIIEEMKIETKKNYKLPPIDVLVQIEKDYDKDRANKENAALKALAIDETFIQFNVNAKVVNTIIGPSVMKFEIQTKPGTKVNSVTSLENDLKLALATNNMRLEAPIPGKTLIGIEIANSFSEMVSMREIIESIPESNKDDKLLFVLGKNVLGQPLTAQLNKMPHLLVAGSTGSGKSVMINTLICSILLRAKPNEVKFIMIDPKKVELSIYSRIPHMLSPVISDMKQAANALKMVVLEMERRYESFMSLGVRNIDGYNKKVSNSKKMPYHVVIIDELADLMMTGDRKAVEESIMRITQMARAAGIHLIVATQRPSVDVITGTIKTNIPTRIAFAVTTGTDSRTILDAIGAENLLGRGDMLFMPPGGGDLMRAQGAFMSDEEIEEIVDFTIAQQQTEYDDKFDGENLSNMSTKDELFGLAKEFALNKETLTTSELKGRFGIGDARAVNIMSQLEESGIIGPKNGAKPREVFRK